MLHTPLLSLKPVLWTLPRVLPPSIVCNPLYPFFHSCQAVAAEQSAATVAAAGTFMAVAVAAVAAQEMLTHDVAVVLPELARNRLISALVSVRRLPTPPHPRQP